MRRALILAALLLSVPAAANPAPVIQAQLSLRDFLHDAIERVTDAAPAEATGRIPDLTILKLEPVARTESSGYGWRDDPVPRRGRRKFHHGSDYRADRGTPVVAAGDGVVIFAGRRGGYGKVVFIDHGGGVITRYAHLNRIDAKVGDTLAAGTRIGEVGSTGRTTGPHLHFEVRLDGRSVDPNTALMVAQVSRESPDAGRIMALALAPEIQAKSRDAQDPANKRAARKAANEASRPERTGAPKRSRALW